MEKREIFLASIPLFWMVRRKGTSQLKEAKSCAAQACLLICRLRLPLNCPMLLSRLPKAQLQLLPAMKEISPEVMLIIRISFQ
jgi:hypothetical protein